MVSYAAFTAPGSEGSRNSYQDLGKYTQVHSSNLVDAITRFNNEAKQRCDETLDAGADWLDESLKVKCRHNFHVEN